MIWLLACAAPTPSAPSLDDFDFFFGDPHAHTGASGDACSADQGLRFKDQCGSLAGIADEARRNGLDFAGLTDHVDGRPAFSTADGGEAFWRAVVDQTFAASADDLLLVPGAEVIVTEDDDTVRLGHKTMLLFGDEAELAPLLRHQASPSGGVSSDVTSCDALWSWADDLEARFGPVLLLPHHPAASMPMPTDFSCRSERLEPGIEIYGHFGDSRIEIDGRSTYDPLLEDDGTYQVAAKTGTAQYLLTAYPDARAGFLAGTDGHRTRPGDVCPEGDDQLYVAYGGGLTGVVLPKGEGLDRSTLHDAIVHRSTYATSGPRVPVLATFLDVAGEGIGAMGQELDAGAVARMRVEVAEPYADEVVAVWAVQAGDEVGAERKTLLTPAGEGIWETPLDGSTGFVYAMIELDGPTSHPAGCWDGDDDDLTERVWTSPTWLE